MEAVVHGFEVRDGQARVHLRGLDGRVPQHFLQMPDRCSGPKHVRRAAVSKRVRRHRAINIRRPNVLAHDVPHRVRPDAGAEAIQKQMPIAIRTQPVGTHASDIGLQ